MQQELDRRKIFCERYGLKSYGYRTDMNPFVGKIVCAKCGTTFGGKSWSNRDIACWKCKEKGCGMKVKEGDIQRVFITAWNSLVKNRESCVDK